MSWISSRVRPPLSRLELHRDICFDLLVVRTDSPVIKPILAEFNQVLRPPCEDERIAILQFSHEAIGIRKLGDSGDEFLNLRLTQWNKAYGPRLAWSFLFLKRIRVRLTGPHHVVYEAARLLGLLRNGEHLVQQFQFKWAWSRGDDQPYPIKIWAYKISEIIQGRPKFLMRDLQFIVGIKKECRDAIA